MKVCEECGKEIGGLDGDNLCAFCTVALESGRAAKLAKRRAARREREAIMRSCGLRKVRGAMGGTYWE